MVGYIESTVSMALQIAVLFLVIVALFLKGQKKYRQHGIFMLSAVVLHIISILTVMSPSFFAFIGPGSINLANVWVILTLFHALAGAIAVLLGVVLILAWRLKVDLRSCFKKKRLMDVTLVLWILSIILGIFIYLLFVGAI